MGLRHRTRLRAAALGMAAVTLMGLAGCEGGDENGEDGQMQQDGGEQEEEGE